MKTSTITTTICRHTGVRKPQTITENEGEVDEAKFYKPLVEIFYRDMKEKGVIK